MAFIETSALSSVNINEAFKKLIFEVYLNRIKDNLVNKSVYNHDDSKIVKNSKFSNASNLNTTAINQKKCAC